jgi:hypothetical protein
MAAFPWAWLLAGLLLGSWIGATVGSAAVLLLAGRRAKLKTGIRRSRPAPVRAPAPGLRPFRVVTETARIPIDRIATGN